MDDIRGNPGQFPGGEEEAVEWEFGDGNAEGFELPDVGAVCRKENRLPDIGMVAEEGRDERIDDLLASANRTVTQAMCDMHGFTIVNRRRSLLRRSAH